MPDFPGYGCPPQNLPSPSQPKNQSSHAIHTGATHFLSLIEQEKALAIADAQREIEKLKSEFSEYRTSVRAGQDAMVRHFTVMLEKKRGDAQRELDRIRAEARAEEARMTVELERMRALLKQHGIPLTAESGGAEEHLLDNPAGQDDTIKDKPDALTFFDELQLPQAGYLDSLFLVSEDALEEIQKATEMEALSVSRFFAVYFWLNACACAKDVFRPGPSLKKC
jgi:hypothetical protein